MMKKKLAMLLTAAAIGCTMTPALSTEAAWNVDGAGWWYTHPDGSYTTNSWEWVNGAWYHFDGTGYMQTGWQWIDGAWYYMDGSGAMLTGWQVIDGFWYYLNGNGSMAANQWVGNYYVDGSGRMAANTWIGNYYVGGDGCWIPGYGAAQWIADNHGWWYRHSDGGYTRNGWEQIDGQWYLFDGSGYMQTGWQNVGGTWYYLHGNGVMAANQWIGSYYVNGSGAMMTNTWTPDGYWVNESGVWTPQWHDAVYDDKWVVDKEAWTERKPVIVQHTHAICYCGFDLTAAYLKKYGEDAFVGHWNNGYNEQYTEFLWDVTTHECPKNHPGFKSSNVTYPYITDYEIVNHPEEGHWEKVLVSEGYWK